MTGNMALKSSRTINHVAKSTKCEHITSKYLLTVYVECFHSYTLLLLLSPWVTIIMNIINCSCVVNVCVSWMRFCTVNSVHNLMKQSMFILICSSNRPSCPEINSDIRWWPLKVETCFGILDRLRIFQTKESITQTRRTRSSLSDSNPDMVFLLQYNMWNWIKFQ